MGCPSMQLQANGPAGSSAALICLAAIVALALPAESWPSLAANQQQPINTTQQVATGYVQTRPFQWSTFGVLPNDAAAKSQLSPQRPHGASGNVQTRPDLLVESSAAGTRFKRETEVGSSNSSSGEIGPKKRPKGKKPTGYKPYPQQSDMECWNAHNSRRREHGVLQLDWDKTLAAQAQKHSNWMASKDNFAHSHVKDYGENLAYDTRVDAPCKDMVDRWYKEIDLYNYDNPTFSMATGHFTQMVWRTTKRVGCAFARSKIRTYLTCNYYPSGNWVGEFRENVPPPLTGRPQDVEKPEEPAKPVVPVSPAVPSSVAAVATTSTTTTARPVTTTTLASVYPSSVTPLSDKDKEASTTKPKSKKKKKSNKKKGDKDKKKKGNKKKNKKKKKKSSSTTTTPAPVSVAGDTAAAGGRSSQVDTTSAPGLISS
uniref:Golgi-associated plant pathogenesis-related protein 1 n=1 Tax=Aceria tosichella TaxID=561515 RepID=A0A6G1SL10_9ACAR